MGEATGAFVKLLALLILYGCAAAFADEGLHFQKATVAKMSKGEVQMTRVEISGTVEYVKKEADGDIHFRLCDAGHVCVVCEIMPQIPFPSPKLHQGYTVQGVMRFDGEHKWYEVHPVTGLKKD